MADWTGTAEARDSGGSDSGSYREVHTDTQTHTYCNYQGLRVIVAVLSTAG